MNDPQHAIFRADALQRFARTREESVLPRFVSPPTFVYLWSLLGLLLLVGSIAWFGRPVLSRLFEPESLGEAIHEIVALVRPTGVTHIEPAPDLVTPLPTAPAALPSLKPPASAPAPAAPASAAPVAVPAGAAPKTVVPVMPMGAPVPQDKAPSVPVMPMGAAAPAPSDSTAKDPTDSVRTVGR